MPQRVLSWLFVCAFVAAATLRAQAPAGAPTVTGGAELVLVAKVTGTVTMTLPGQAAVAVKQDDKVEQKAKINTGQNSSVVLVFSNGATTQLGADTELVVEEYLQDPFADTVKVADLTDEPSTSRTRLALNHGELVGNVKKLKYDKGSSFIVQTPVGAAGIRGTTFRIVFRPSGTGQAFFTLSTAVGNVAFDQGNTGGASQGGGGAGGGAQGAQGGGGTQQGAQGGGTNQQGGTTNTGPTVSGTGTANGVAVPQGQEIVLNVTVTTTPSGQVVVTAPPNLAVPVQISQQALQQVNAVAVEIAVAVQQAVFTPPAPAPTTGGGNTGNQQGGNSQGGNQGSGNSNTSGGNSGGNSGGGNSGGTSGSTGGTTGSTGGTTGSTGGTTGSTGGTTGSTTTTTTSAARGGSATTTTTTTTTGSQSSITGQTATGQTFQAQVQATQPPVATPPRIIPTTP